jgi:type I restriction enzyme M protein
VIEQITYLLFIRRLDDLHTLEGKKANRLKKPMARRIFPEGKDGKRRSYEDDRWSCAPISRASSATATPPTRTT